MSLLGAGTLIGRSLVIRGEVSGSEDLYVDGSIEGTVTLAAGRLTVGPNARLTADVQAPEVAVMGELNGNLRSEGKVELRDKSTMRGDILAIRLAVEEGAVLRGHVDLRGPEEKAEDAAPVVEESSLFQHK
ncbi:polymer-forming cytoskeletal protein [Terriglobus albidus]|uniref:Polymer-forming cytoskeletal protein n=1 Tax=Terriglobus albidus TaxID=1592106 RepID=A0A5B9ECF8_9BACT|nr:polymer-forming cytoskeletal protein [Terriglobus albidus]QEE29792.1 polymer-forming cytoskeletal protein [Terriglobus albidus]